MSMRILDMYVYMYVTSHTLLPTYSPYSLLILRILSYAISYLYNIYIHIYIYNMPASQLRSNDLFNIDSRSQASPILKTDEGITL